MKYLMLVSGPATQGMPPANVMVEVERRAQVAASKQQFVMSGGLTRAITAYHVEGGELSVKDGPFTESKEVVGGFAIFDIPTRDDALQGAKEFAEVHRDLWPGCQMTITVREVFEPHGA